MYYMDAIVYDILKENNQFIINIYESGIISNQVKNKNQSKRTYRILSTINTNNKEELEVKVQEFRNKGMISITDFGNNSTAGLIFSDYLEMIKLTIFKRFKVVERWYDIRIKNNQEYFGTFITYIDMNTGKVYKKDMGIFNLVNDPNREILEINGYQNKNESWQRKRI